MITAKEREKGFRDALAALLERHGAEMVITDDRAGYGMHQGIVVITMPTIYDDHQNAVADFAEFEL